MLLQLDAKTIEFCNARRAIIEVHCIPYTILGRHGSASLCRVEREKKMAATYNVLAFKR